MMKLFLFSLLFSASLLFSEHCLVFIHIGYPIPAYTNDALNQARLFNPDCPIYLIANNNSLKNHPLPANIKALASESLKATREHLIYSKLCKKHEGFWRFTSERFLVLHDFIQQTGHKNVFHLENDVMLYANLSDLLPIFEKNYPGIGATFDNDDRCIPGFVYIKTPENFSPLATAFSNLAHKKYNDMQIFSIFEKSNPHLIDFLPVAPYNYIANHSMISLHHHQSTDKFKFCRNAEEFNSLFDAAALGQYLGGDNGHYPPGFINESTLYNPSHFTYSFIPDEKGRLIPYLIYEGVSYRINTLHIHSKNLKQFSSLN